MMACSPAETGARRGVDGASTAVRFNAARFNDA